MSKPDIEPKKTASGIAVDPKTLERVIPETRRPDGSVRKQLKVRPGFTPQEDVSRFRGSRQQQLDRNQLPKGHILGWVAPSGGKKPGASGSDGGVGGGDKGISANAAKRAKKKAKKQAEKDEVIRKAWDEDSDEDKQVQVKVIGSKTKVGETKDESGDKGAVAATTSKESENTNAAAEETTKSSTSNSREGDALAEELEKKLDVH